ncbi:MAG: bifunctional metallophosphatase/5'-nucleotidase [Bacilli bacterium]|nr:bifunctional metallophosphatase/5'-nucleotidase [Bacilli bacterium]
MKNKLLLLPIILLLAGCETATSESLPEDNKLIDVSEKEYYKSLVDRSKITYTDKLENDPNHDVDSIEIFQLNDTHGAYYTEDDVTGIAHVKTCINQNIEDPFSVVKIANGDMLQGTAFSNMLLGEPGIVALNEMHFDAFTIGNHEFDWSLDNLKVYKDGDLSNGELNCPFLGANIIDKDGKRPDWIEPYTVVEKGDVKVGILGLIGDGLESSISKVALGGYSFTSTFDAVDKYTKILKEEEKVDVVILASHAHDEVANQRYVNNNKIDCIINGHDHWRVEEYVNRFDGKLVPVIESQTKNITIGKVTLNLDENKEMNSFSMEHLKPSFYPQDAKLKELMDVYYDITGVYQNEVIGFKHGGFSKAELGISTCTYIAEKYEADIAFMNTGGVRSEITSSEITNGLVYEALPFDNELYITYLKGSELVSMISNNSMSGYYFNDSGLGTGRGYSITDVEYKKTYKVIAVDYVATKDRFAIYFNEEHGLIMSGDYIRDCALENIKQNFKN